ncbi:hypothetical protein [Methylibium sp.]|uniref:hypothetical protein n=1 Tax=Methylibium sp. TaxID=2067992 RepID=UPI003D0F8167
MSGPRYAGVEILLDGTPHIVPPLTLGAIEDFQDRLASAGARPDVGLVIDLLTRGLKRNYPDITREAVREGIDLGAMYQIFNSVLGASGFTAEADEGNAVATASGTGAPSMPTSSPASDGPSSTAASTSPLSS